MLRRIVQKVILGVLLLWLAIFSVDFVTVSCFDHAPICCVKDDDRNHFRGLGYSYDAYPHPISGGFEYCLYVFGISTKSTFTN